ALTGDLTIKGITRPVTLEVQRLGEVSHEQMGHRIAYTAEGQIMRRDFGMAFDMLADNRLVVGQEGKITVEGGLVEVPAPVAGASRRAGPRVAQAAKGANDGRGAAHRARGSEADGRRR